MQQDDDGSFLRGVPPISRRKRNFGCIIFLCLNVTIVCGGRGRRLCRHTVDVPVVDAESDGKDAI